MLTRRDLKWEGSDLMLNGTRIAYYMLDRGRNLYRYKLGGNLDGITPRHPDKYRVYGLKEIQEIMVEHVCEWLQLSEEEELIMIIRNNFKFHRLQKRGDTTGYNDSLKIAIRVIKKLQEIAAIKNISFYVYLSDPKALDYYSVAGQWDFTLNSIFKNVIVRKGINLCWNEIIITTESEELNLTSEETQQIRRDYYKR